MTAIPKDWENIANLLTPEGFESIRVDEVLTFNRDGSEHHYKVMKKTKKRLYIAPVKLYDPGDITAVNNETGERVPLAG
ncbi:hypothetical protein GS464_29585 [Rhodococcus hoagii]|nr:hypothetical protein [Prescottella equi]MBM4644783.1 hypothetical protein [Prescottella equi]MBM4646570.1 hypothetical protein [Prescottella equi]